MDDREREALAQRVASAVRGPNWGNQTTLDDARIAVDVVLAALGDRLLPELPEWVTHGGFYEVADPPEEPRRYMVWLSGDNGNEWKAIGPTVAGAIRDAVAEEGEEPDGQ